MTDLKRRNLDFSGTSFLILFRTSILELALEHTNLSLLSRTSRNNYAFDLHIINSNTSSGVVDTDVTYTSNDAYCFLLFCSSLIYFFKL